jgi:hypothetical protein
MPTPDRLARLMAAALPAPDAGDWRRQMERAIAQGHTAAFLAGTAERLGVSAGGALVSERRLSRAERREITAAVARQLRYLDGFDPAGMSEAAIKARADLYAGAVKATYYAARWGDWEIPDALMPGMQQCLGNCLCFISIKDNGDGTGVLTREMGGTEHHCQECPPLAGDHPVKRRAA